MIFSHKAWGIMWYPGKPMAVFFILQAFIKGLLGTDCASTRGTMGLSPSFLRSRSLAGTIPWMSCLQILPFPLPHQEMFRLCFSLECGPSSSGESRTVTTLLLKQSINEAQDCMGFCTSDQLYHLPCRSFPARNSIYSSYFFPVKGS